MKHWLSGWRRTCRGVFENPILSVDMPVALAWGDLMEAARRRGLGLSSIDGPVAATATARDLALVTRNIRDLDGRGIELLDPWNA